MCLDSGGRPDYTSVFVDLASVSSKTGCYAWTSECTFDLLRVSSIVFDVDLRNCASVWACPLWISPSPWVAPAQTSGEIDFVELCPRGAVATNFGAGGEPGEREQSWASAFGLEGPRRFTMTIGGGGGTLATRICRLDGSDCFDGAVYENFLSVAASTRGRSVSFPYHINVDVWNGYGGDGGWYGCGAQNDPQTTCQFAIRNIRIHSKDGGPIFGGKCAALNGYGDASLREAQSVPNSTLVV